MTESDLKASDRNVRWIEHPILHEIAKAQFSGVEADLGTGLFHFGNHFVEVHSGAAQLNKQRCHQRFFNDLSALVRRCNDSRPACPPECAS
jgi:hypothetical protein